MAKGKFPATIYVYEVDGGSGETWLAIATGLEGIPEGQDGKTVATYSVKRTNTFKIGRVLG